MNSIHIYTQRDSSWSSHFPETIYGADNDATTVDEICPVSIGIIILWRRRALTTTRRAHQNQSQQENLLLGVQRKISESAVSGSNYDQLYWYVRFSYVYTMVSSGIWNDGGIWCCLGYIIIAPHHSCYFLSPSCLIQIWANIFGEGRSSATIVHMGASSLLGHNSLVITSWHTKCLESQPQQDKYLPDVQRRLFLLVVLGPHYKQLYWCVISS